MAENLLGEQKKKKECSRATYEKKQKLKNFNTGRQKQQAPEQRQMWGEEEVIKKQIWKHEQMESTRIQSRKT